MAFPQGNRKQGFVQAPRANQTSGPPGQVYAITVSGTPDFLDLAKGNSQAVTDRTSGADKKQITRNYITIECDVDLAIIFGSTSALVTGGNAPVIATVGTNTSGVYANAAGTAFVLYSKQPRSFLLQDGVDLFMGFVASAGGIMRMYQSSPDNA